MGHILQIINDLSSILEDANTTVSNFLTFGPDESDITDQLEILQVNNYNRAMRFNMIILSILNFVKSYVMRESLLVLLLHRWPCQFFVRYIPIQKCVSRSIFDCIRIYRFTEDVFLARITYLMIT